MTLDGLHLPLRLRALKRGTPEQGADFKQHRCRLRCLWPCSKSFLAGGKLIKENQWISEFFRSVQGALIFCLTVVPAWRLGAQCVHVQDVSGKITGQAPYQGRMIYHAASGKMVSLDEDYITPAHHGWVYDGTGWTAMPDPPFPARISFVWVYDSVRKVGLLFGAPLPALAHAPPELWAYDGSQWRQLTWTGPSPPVIAGGPWGAFDPNRGRAIFFYTGRDSSTIYHTWEWTGSAWEQGPDFTPYFPDDFIFDVGHNVGFVAGKNSAQNDEVWYYHPAATAANGVWEQKAISGPAHETLLGATLAYDPYRQRIFRCCGHYPNDIYSAAWIVTTWDFAHTLWAEDFPNTNPYSLPTSDARGAALAAYDINRDLLVLAGGLSFHPDADGNPAPTNWHDTWESSTDEPGLAGASATSLTHCAGDDAVFAMTGVGSGVSYQWYHNAVPIQGATFPLLVIHNVSTTDAGNYVGRVQNSCGYMDTPINRLSVDVPTTIFSQAFFPDCSQICLGGIYTIDPPIPFYNAADLMVHLQRNIGSVVTPIWDDVRVAPASYFPGSRAFAFTNIQKDFTGAYRFYIDGSSCPGIVASATHFVQVGFAIISQPQSLSNVRPCSTVSFSVGTSGGCGLKFSWVKYGWLPVQDDGHYVGANTPTLTIDGVHYDDEATYSCVVIDTNQCNNTIISATATLKLVAPQWVLRTTSGPSPRERNAMAYDSARGVTVMYGGGLVDPTAGYLGMGELWEWDGSRWKQRTTYNWTNAWHQDAQGYWRPNYGATPAARMQHAMAYDSRRGRTVMFGGRGAVASGVPGDFAFNDTWEWDGTSWIFRATNGPSARFDHHMAYDSVRGVTVLYGGFPANPLEVWEWNGSNWNSVTTTNWSLNTPTNGPTPNYYQSPPMDFDTSSGMTFVGATTDGSYSRFYWAWDGHDWHPRQPGFSSYYYYTPVYGAMVYDTYRYRSLYYGGIDNGNFGGSTACYYDSATGTWSSSPTDLRSLTLDEVQSSLFTNTDFINLTNLLSKLSGQADPVSQFLWGQFPASTQQTLTNPAVALDQKAITLAGTLDSFIISSNIYNPNTFATVTLSLETRVFQAVSPQGRDEVRFNRLLLEDAYPAEIARSLSTPPGRYYHAMAFDSARRCAVLMGGYYGGPGINPLNGSDTWELMYLEAPLINDQPASQYRAPGDTAVFNVNAVGPQGTKLSYDWYFGAVPLSDGGRISGAHSATLRVANVNANDSGQYQVRISSTCGSIYSIPAILTTSSGLQIFTAQNTFTLIWALPSVVLEQADTPAGPWSQVLGATSPYDISIESPGKFFRLRSTGP